MTRLTITALAALALAVPAASAAPVRQEAAPSIAGIAASSPQFSTLLSLVKKAGLAGTLSKPGAYTVFAPTNAAFAKVPKATLNALGKNPAQLKRVLLYHVVAGKVTAAQGGEAALGEDARRPDGDASASRARPCGSTASKVTKADVKASNGIVHVIDRVLLPPA